MWKSEVSIAWSPFNIRQMYGHTTDAYPHFTLLFPDEISYELPTAIRYFISLFILMYCVGVRPHPKMCAPYKCYFTNPSPPAQTNNGLINKFAEPLITRTIMYYHSLHLRQLNSILLVIPMHLIWMVLNK